MATKPPSSSRSSTSSTSTSSSSFASAAELIILLTNIDILEDKLKITRRHLNGLNERIKGELKREPFTFYEINLLNLLLNQHQIVVNQYNEEYTLLTDLQMKLAEEINQQIMAKRISIDQNGKIIVTNKRNKPYHKNIRNDNKKFEEKSQEK